MEIRNIKKYITVNLISLLGYTGIAFLLLYNFVIKQSANIYNISNNIPVKNDYGSSVVFVGFWIFYCILFLFFVLLAFIEHYVRKKYSLSLINNLALPQYIKKLYTILFWGGIILSLMPLYLILYILFTFLISSF